MAVPRFAVAVPSSKLVLAFQARLTLRCYVEFEKTSLIMKNMKTLLALATVVILGPLALTAADGKNGFQPLFNGKDMAGWKLRNPDGHKSWSVLPGGILKN